MKKLFRCICLIVICACLAGCSSPYAEFLQNYQQTYGTVPEGVYRVYKTQSLASKLPPTTYTEVRSSIDMGCRRSGSQWALVCAQKKESSHYYPKDPDAHPLRFPFTWTEIEITRVLDQRNYCEDWDEFEPGDIVTVEEAYSFKPDGTFYYGADVWGSLILQPQEQYVMVIYRSAEGDDSTPAGISQTGHIFRLDQNTVNLTTVQELKTLEEQEPPYFSVDVNADVTLDILRLYRESLAKED